jgi:hypothetical protein
VTAGFGRRAGICDRGSMPGEQDNSRERALAAIDAATGALKNPRANSYETAQVQATIAVAEALLTVAEEIRAKT